MKTILLAVVPNQSLTATLNGVRWSLRIVAGDEGMLVDVTRDDVLLVQGKRALAGCRLLGFPHLSGAGDWAFWTAGEDQPDWRKFGSQTLQFIEPSEIPG